MKKVVTDTETIIYPMLHKTDKETDEDFCIVLGNSVTLINDRIIDEDDIQLIIDALQVAQEIIYA